MNLSLLLSEPVNMPAPLGFDSWLTFWLVIVVSVVNAGMLCLAGYKFLQVFGINSCAINVFPQYNSICFSW